MPYGGRRTREILCGSRSVEGDGREAPGGNRKAGEWRALVFADRWPSWFTPISTATVLLIGLGRGAMNNARDAYAALEGDYD